MTVDDSGHAKPEFQPLDVFRWEVCHLAADDAQRADDVLALFSAELPKYMQRHDGLPLAVRVIVTGRSRIHADLMADPIRWTNDIRATALDASAGGVWVEKVKLQTSLAREFDGESPADGPIGELLRYFNEIRDDEAQLRTCLKNSPTSAGNCRTNCSVARTVLHWTTRRDCGDGSRKPNLFCSVELLKGADHEGPTTGFAGVWSIYCSDARVRPTHAGLHVVYGPNEAGKSSSLRARRQWLYGIPHNSSDNFVHSHQNLRIGGLLEDTRGNQFAFIRRKGRDRTMRGSDDAEVLEPSDLVRMLGGVDEVVFGQRFGISYEELRRGGLRDCRRGRRIVRSCSRPALASPMFARFRHESRPTCRDCSNPVVPIRALTTPSQS